MIGGSSASQNPGNFLINFNSAGWANQVNAQLQNAIQQGLQYSEKYAGQAIKAVEDYAQQSRKDMQQGFARAQALDAPKHLATYNALDTYLGTLGQATPAGGSFQLAKALENSAMGIPVNPQQQQMAAGYNRGITGPVGLFTPPTTTTTTGMPPTGAPPTGTPILIQDPPRN